MPEYLEALARLRDAERLASRYPTPAVLHRVIAAQRAVHEAYERLSAEARSRRPVRIGQSHGPGFYRPSRHVARNTQPGSFHQSTDRPFGG